MSARLQYAKVLDQFLFFAQGARVHPGLANKVLLRGEEGKVGAFLVIRAWGEGRGTFTEQWRLEGPGAILYESIPREIHIAARGHQERLQDEVSDLQLDGLEEGLTAVFILDEREVARISIAIEEDRLEAPGES